MADKPATICQLEKGKFVGGQKNFVDTFNWVAQSMANLVGGEGVDIDWTLPDHPVINVTDTSNNDSGDGEGYGDDNPVVELSAGSENEDAQFDAENQDWLMYTKADGTETTIALPYVNGVKELSISADANGDKTLNWTYTRLSSIGGPEDLGIEFASGQDTTDSHSKFNLTSASDSNVQFTLNGQTIQIGVYYV